MACFFHTTIQQIIAITVSQQFEAKPRFSMPRELRFLSKTTMATTTTMIRWHILRSIYGQKKSAKTQIQDGGRPDLGIPHIFIRSMLWADGWKDKNFVAKKVKVRLVYMYIVKKESDCREFVWAIKLEEDDWDGWADPFSTGGSRSNRICLNRNLPLSKVTSESFSYLSCANLLA